MHSDKLKNEFALLSIEVVSFNSVNNKLNDMGSSFLDSAAFQKMKINIHKEHLKYEDNIYYHHFWKKSQTVAPNDIFTDVLDEYNPVNRIPVNLENCIVFSYFLVLFFTMSLFYQHRKCHI